MSDLRIDLSLKSDWQTIKKTFFAHAQYWLRPEIIVFAADHKIVPEPLACMAMKGEPQGTGRNLILRTSDSSGF